MLSKLMLVMKNKLNLILIFLMSAFIISCGQESSSPRSSGTDNFSGGSGSGTGGSLARFAVVNNNLFVVNNHQLFSYSITDPAKPVLKKSIGITAEVETIFAMDDYLLLGTQSGMEIFSISSPDFPTFVSRYNHIVSCDPVVAKDGFAYSTLRTGNQCNRGENRLDFIDIQNIYNPQQIGSMNLVNPKGLGISGHYLYVCDNSKVIGIDITSPYFPVSAGETNVEGCYDIIGGPDKIIVAASSGVSQFTVTESGTLNLLSTITTD
jgi:hypothetical protein